LFGVDLPHASGDGASVTTIRVRAVPVGKALQLTRRALAIGPRFTYAGALDLMGDWWEQDADWRRPANPELFPDDAHPFTFALRILETSP